MAIKTVSIDTAKSLKEAGFRQDTYFNWYKVSNEIPKVEHYNVTWDDYIVCSAPTCDELIEELPTFISIEKCKVNDVPSFIVSYEEKKIFNSSLIECLSLMWIWIRKKEMES